MNGATISLPTVLAKPKKEPSSSLSMYDLDQPVEEI
jgi:hypothetical protein